MTTIRALIILMSFFIMTLLLIPVQAALLKFWPVGARRFPHWYHRKVCRLFGIKINLTGHVDKDRPVLLVSNHTSWLDIPVLSAIAPVSFVAKKEVASWPFVSWLARLQRSVFVDRERRTDVGRAMHVMLDRLSAGDKIVLFPEGTSSDGNRVLNFRSSLFAAAKPPVKFLRPGEPEIVVQTLAVVYQRLHGIPLGRTGRKSISWYGDMDMLKHAWDYLKSGPLDVDIVVGPPQALESFADRKDLARRTEIIVRTEVMRMLRGLAHDSVLEVAALAPDVLAPPAIVSGHGEDRRKELAAKKWR